jgi:hypothetical protein
MENNISNEYWAHINVFRQLLMRLYLDEYATKSTAALRDELMKAVEKPLAQIPEGYSADELPDIQRRSAHIMDSFLRDIDSRGLKRLSTG